MMTFFIFALINILHVTKFLSCNYLLITKCFLKILMCYSAFKYVFTIFNFIEAKFELHLSNQFYLECNLCNLADNQHMVDVLDHRN